jgi:hypothetical protein
MLTLGLAACFAGFRLFVILLPIWGFFAGFISTAQAIQQLFGGGFLATVSSWVIAFVIGVLFAVMAYFFYYAAVIVLAATVGYEIGVGLMAGFGVNAGFIQFIVGLGVALALSVAVIALNLPKVFIIALTALGGASMILTGILLAFGGVTLETLNLGLVVAFVRSSWFWFLVYVAIVVVGIAAQSMVPDTFKLTPYAQEQTSYQAPTVQPTTNTPMQPYSAPTPPSDESETLRA